MSRQAPPPVQKLPSTQRVKRAYNYTETPGRPRLYKTAAELEQACNEYFDSCFEITYEYKTDEYGEYLEEHRKQVRPWTITGLAVYLGMTREGLLYYEGIDENFLSTIKNAKQKCQMYAEEQTFRAGGQVAGPIFNLKANYGWVETVRKEIVGADGTPLFLDADSADQRAKRNRQLLMEQIAGD